MTENRDSARLNGQRTKRPMKIQFVFARYNDKQEWFDLTLVLTNFKN